MRILETMNGEYRCICILVFIKIRTGKGNLIMLIPSKVERALNIIFLFLFNNSIHFPTNNLMAIITRNETSKINIDQSCIQACARGSNFDMPNIYWRKYLNTWNHTPGLAKKKSNRAHENCDSLAICVILYRLPKGMIPFLPIISKFQHK